MRAPFMEARILMHKKLNLVAGGVALILAAAAGAAEAPAPSTPIVLKAAHLFDSVSGKLVDHGVVVVVGKKIQAVGRGCEDSRGRADHRPGRCHSRAGIH